MNTNDECILLLSKQFTGEISRAEAVLLDEWLRQSPDNERLAAELQQVWEKTGTYQKTFSPNLAADFQLIEARLGAELTATSNPPFGIRLGRVLLRAAAVLVLLLASVWGWRNFSTSPAVLLTASATESEKQWISLPDGSRVCLRHNAVLEYPAQFNGQQRRVKLTTGEAYFEVAHNAAQPFIVETPEGDLIRVLGTEFGVNLADRDHVTVAVRSGRVQFAPKAKPEGVVLTAREKATFERTNAQITISRNVNLNELAWQAGGLEFVRTPLAQVTAELEEYYKVKITLRNPALQNCPHTAPLTNQPIRKVLESLALTYQMRVVEITPEQFDLLGGKCE